MSIITGDLPDVSSATYQTINDCAVSGLGVPALKCSFVDDVVLVVDQFDIDGPGNVLAQAGPWVSRAVGKPGQYLTISGILTIDSSGELHL